MGHGGAGRARAHSHPRMSNDVLNLAVLFADVSGSTKLYETVGDAEALRTIGRCLSLVRLACEGQGGRVVKTIGAEIMAVFPPADTAAGAAAERQAPRPEMRPPRPVPA